MSNVLFSHTVVSKCYQKDYGSTSVRQYSVGIVYNDLSLYNELHYIFCLVLKTHWQHGDYLIMNMETISIAQLEILCKQRTSIQT